MNQEMKDNRAGMRKGPSEKMKQILKTLTDHLNRRVNSISTKSKKIALLLFGLTTSGICFLLIAQSLGTTEKPSGRSQDIFASPGNRIPETEVLEKPMTEQEIIRKYNHYIDSLNANSKTNHQ